MLIITDAAAAFPKLIGKPKPKRQSKGVYSVDVEILWKGTEAELKDKLPKIGEEIEDSFAPKRTETALGDPKNEVLTSEADWLGGTGENSLWMWKLTISTTSDSRGGGGNAPTKENLKKKVDCSYALKELYLDPAWWGIVKADKDMTGDAPNKTDKQKLGGKNATIEVFKTHRNIKGVKCRIGDFVYKNGYPDIKINKVTANDDDGKLQTDSVAVEYVHPSQLDANPGKYPYPATGGVNAYLSPYGKKLVPESGEAADQWNVENGPSESNVDYAGQKCKVVLYTVTYYVKNSSSTNSASDDHSFWAGISPESNPFGTTSVPKKLNALKPKNWEVKNFWKAIDQKIREVKDTDGNLWAEITRTMESAPVLSNSKWCWSIAKSFHNEWNWGTND